MTEYIKREDALRHRRKMSGADFGGEFWDFAVLCEDIERIPAADVEPVIHACWVLRQSNDYAVCSHCCHGDHVDPVATHCRYCGAKMDGVK